MIDFKKEFYCRIVALVLLVVCFLDSTSHPIDTPFVSQKSQIRKILDFDAGSPEVVRYLAVAISKSIKESLPHSKDYISIEHTPLKILKDMGKELGMDLLAI